MMGLTRNLKRKNLKDKTKEMENIIRKIDMDGRNINREIAKVNVEIRNRDVKINELQEELKFAKEVILAMAINNVRNDNAEDFNSISYSFLHEASERYTLDMRTILDTLMITIVPVSTENEEGLQLEEGKA